MYVSVKQISVARENDEAAMAMKSTVVSPGPVYLPDDRCFGHGPHGIGPEYTLRPSHRFPREERNTRQSEFPGPRYMLPRGLGKQVESTKRSFTVGKFSESEIVRMDIGQEV